MQRQEKQTSCSLADHLHVFAAVEQKKSLHAQSCAPNPPARLDPQHGLLEAGMVRTGAHVREGLHLFCMPPRAQHLSGRVMHAQFGETGRCQILDSESQVCGNQTGTCGLHRMSVRQSHRSHLSGCLDTHIIIDIVCPHGATLRAWAFSPGRANAAESLTNQTCAVRWTPLIRSCTS